MASELRQRIFTTFFYKYKVSIFLGIILSLWTSWGYSHPERSPEGRGATKQREKSVSFESWRNLELKNRGRKGRLLSFRGRLRLLSALGYRERIEKIEITLRVTGRVKVSWGEAPADERWRLPHRIYIDLSPCIPVRKLRYRAITIGGKVVKKIRIGRNTLTKTRVVIEVSKKVPFEVNLRENRIKLILKNIKDMGNNIGKESKGKSFIRKKIREKRKLSRKRTRRAGRSNGRIKERGGIPIRLPFPFTVDKVAIDAGHGGREEGAIGRRYGLKEKWLTLNIARYTVKFLSSKGVKAFLVRRGDETLSLDQRVRRVKRGGADILVSIHINSSYNIRLSGVSTYFLFWTPDLDSMRLISHNPLLARENQGIHPKQFSDLGSVLNGLNFQSNLIISKILARTVQSELIGSLSRLYPSVRNLGVKRGLFYLLFASGIPSILTEISFISNPQEEKLLKTKGYLKAAARGVAEGIIRFIRLTRGQRKGRNQKSSVR